MFKSKFLYLEYVLFIFIIFFIASIFIYNENIIQGFYNIITSPSILFSDYILIGGISATLLNVILVTTLNLFIAIKTKMKITGAYFAAVFIIIGFAFFGKNILNILPIYFGTYLYALSENKSFKNYFVIAMFATGLAPIVSFGFNDGVLMTLIGVIIGIVYGFIIPTFSVHVIRFHGGYTLYNIGFAGGIIALIFYSLLMLFDIKHTIELTYSTDYSIFLYIIILTISVLYLILGFDKQNGKKTYKKLLSMSGRAITDFTMIFEKTLAYRNVGLLGILNLIYLIIFRVELNGIIFGAVLTVVGFGTFGKHIKNVIPIMVGVTLTGLLHYGEVTTSVVIIALFATSLAPIAGDFGLIAGIVAGFMHFSIVVRTSEWQGGMNLYNNGFASGFVAAIISSILDTIEFKKLFRRHKHETS